MVKKLVEVQYLHDQTGKEFPTFLHTCEMLEDDDNVEAPETVEDEVSWRMSNVQLFLQRILPFFQPYKTKLMMVLHFLSQSYIFRVQMSTSK
ncbi:hypothetical protein ACF0H5_020731 [Mactra antiquata]